MARIFPRNVILGALSDKRFTSAFDLIAKPVLLYPEGIAAKSARPPGSDDPVQNWKGHTNSGFAVNGESRCVHENF
jgi:hypothetical protein